MNFNFELESRQRMSFSSSRSFDSLRQQMVLNQIQYRGVKDSATLFSMCTVPRHLFVPDSIIPKAYDDCPFPIGNGQTISQPYIVALMTEAAQLKPADKVLEVGTGCGYAAAVYAQIAEQVYSTEIIEDLGAMAIGNLIKAGISNVQVEVTDGSVGLLAHAPYDAVIIACAAPNVPKSLMQQLNVGGRLIIPVKYEDGEKLLRVVKITEVGEHTKEVLEHVRFVPLVGKEGFAVN